MADLIVTTFDWVPIPPRGFVRDIRVCWALEEAGLPYRVESTPFHTRGTAHLAHQPFAQVPWLTDDGILLFETGAILLHLGEKSTKLMPGEAVARASVISWLFAALNSIESVTGPWSTMAGSPDAKSAPDWAKWDKPFKDRMKHLDAVLAERQWLAGNFSIADILMADTLRIPDALGGLQEFPACGAYLARAIARPAFVKAHADQMARFAKAD